jgi:hypothetical protein
MNASEAAHQEVTDPEVTQQDDGWTRQGLFEELCRLMPADVFFTCEENDRRYPTGFSTHSVTLYVDSPKWVTVRKVPHPNFLIRDTWQHVADEARPLLKRAFGFDLPQTPGTPTVPQAVQPQSAESAA